MARPTQTDAEPRWSSRLLQPFTSPVPFAVLVGLLALAMRLTLPWSDPFSNYFQIYLDTNGTGLGHNLAARIGHLGSHAADQIADILNDEGSTLPEIEAAARLAGYTQDERLVPLLERLAAPPNDATVRLAALKSLAELGGSGAASLLEEALGDANEDIRVAALGIVGPNAAPEIAGLLERSARSRNRSERAAAVAALGRMDAPLARKTLWRLYKEAADMDEILGAKRALLLYGPPSPEERVALAHAATGYLPYGAPLRERKSLRQLERRLDAFLGYRLEERLSRAGTDDATLCETESECEARERYYRDLIRRKTHLESRVEIFELLEAPGARATAAPLLFVRASWYLREKLRYLSLSMVRQLESGPAVFPVRELGFDTFEGTALSPSDASDALVGEVLRVRGGIRSYDLEVELAVPVAGQLTRERYRFEGGVFVPVEGS